MAAAESSFKAARARRIVLALALLFLIAMAYGLRKRFGLALVSDWLQSLGPWAPFVYMLIFLLAPALFLPGAPITIAGGAIFGPMWGTFYSVVGATGGATLAFLISRHLAGEWAELKAGGIVKRLKQGVEEEGWRFVAFTRLVPLFPFNLLNYGFGLTRIKLSHYVAASFFCMIPGAAAYSLIGYAGREAVLGHGWPLLKISTVLGIILFLFMLPRLLRRLKEPEDSQG
ncbi:MAG: TVP38/TMEM64 family protein [Deltaproteobacteria bacterium]|nr:MAG: TVP38/TMEM64 family protein [Deltaproteobacteria bacterium]